MLNATETTMGPSLAIGLAGHTGRFGREVLAAVDRRGWFTCWRRNRTGIQSSAMPALLFDCSAPESVPQSIDTALALGIPLVIATSGVDWRRLPRVQFAAARVPIVIASNLSRGHLLQMTIARLVAARPDADMRVMIVDRHPETKKDTPSATAYRLAGAVGADRMIAVRSGPPVADHQIVLAWAGETLEINHRVTSLEAPAEGALCAIEAASRLERPGIYDLDSPELQPRRARSAA